MARAGVTTSYRYDRADRITLAGAVSHQVNANGNLAFRGNDSFLYDQANRLTSATVGGQTTSATYNGDGLRVSQTTGGTTLNYLYDVNRRLPVVLVEHETKYVYGPQGLAYAELPDGTVHVYHQDGLGSTRAITSGTGEVLQTYRTDAFGNPDPGGTTGSVQQPMQYTGEPRDSNELIYLRARYYDPQIGRFMSRDPFGGFLSAPLSLNRYSYVLNNPTNLTDPSGLWPSMGEWPPRPIDCSDRSNLLSRYVCQVPDVMTNWGARVRLPNEILDIADQLAGLGGDSAAGEGARMTTSRSGSGGAGLSPHSVPMPAVSDKKLQNIVNALYKGHGSPRQIGTGSTADAVRNELVTGLPTEGTWHTQKARENVAALNRWIRKNPTSPDLPVAKALLNDLQQALLRK